jgi:hypothetical protein
MREIKFRAWDEETKQLTEGLPLKEICSLQLLHGGEVRPSVTFLQFTGLKAKGVEIYEGDILENDTEWWEVVFLGGQI